MDLHSASPPVPPPGSAAAVRAEPDAGVAPSDLSGMSEAERMRRLIEVVKVFLWQGVTGIGGPAAHITTMERETVQRRNWLTQQEFLDLLGATNLIPGPNSTEMAIHIGYLRAGWPGLIAAGACFILPAAIITSALGWVYVRYGALPSVQPALRGLQAAVVAVVLVVVFRLGRSALKTPGLYAIAAGSMAASLLGAPELLVVPAGGVVFSVARRIKESRESKHKPPGAPPSNPTDAVSALARLRRTFSGMSTFLVASALGLLSQRAQAAVQAAGASAPSAAVHIETVAQAASAVPHIATPPLWQILVYFLKVGSIVYGSGYVLVAFLQRGLVQELNWMPTSVLLDAVAAGQVTPGPVFTTATFLGYVLGGPGGAAAATLGIFMPSFMMVGLLSLILARLRRARWLRSFLDGVNASSLALMAAVAVQLAPRVFVSFQSIALAVVVAVLGVVLQVNPSLLVIGGGVVGWVLAI